MQSFIRAGKTHATCRCRSCLTVVRTSIRNMTTGPNSRKPTLSEVVTGCYTAAFGTFAVIDAKFKDKRQDDLDAQINETKSAIAALQAENAILLAKHSDKIGVEEDGDMAVNPDARSASQKVFVPDPTSNEPAYLHWEEHGSKMFDVFKTEEYWKTLPVLKRTNYKRMKRWLEEEHANDSGDQTMSFTDDELSMRENEVANFVRSILGKVDPNVETLGNNGDLRSHIESLLAQDFPKFDNSPQEESQATNSTLSEYLVKGVETNREHTVENICYNLLVSPVVPNGHTFNSLLLKLGEAGYHSISEELVMNVRSHFRTYRNDYPTAVCLLNHSKEAHRVGLLYNYVTKIFTANTYTATKVMITRATDQGRLLFETIIKALMGLYKLKDAAEMLCRALIIGNIINSWAIIQLFSVCIYAMDRTAAMIIIRALANTPTLLDHIFIREAQIQSILLHQIQYLITITGLPEVPESIHDEVFHNLQVNSDGFNRLQSSLGAHDIRLQKEQAGRALRRLRRSSAPRNADVMGRETEAALDDFDFHWSAASPRNWFGKNITPESSLEPDFEQFTYLDYVDAQASIRAALAAKIVSTALRETQTLIIQTNKALERVREKHPDGLGHLEGFEEDIDSQNSTAQAAPEAKGAELIEKEETEETEAEILPVEIELLQPYVPAWTQNPGRRREVLRGWERRGEALPTNQVVPADALLKKKIALLESLQRGIPSRTTWST